MTESAPQTTNMRGETGLTDRYLTGEYLEKSPGWHVADAGWKARKILELVKRNEISLLTVCDVGCGAGEVLVELKAGLPAEVRFTGYDISPQAIAICAPKADDRLVFKRADFLAESRETPDLLLLLDVFEHVPDYLGFLSALSTRSRNFVFHIPLDLSLEAMVHRVSPMIYMRERYGHLHYFTAETALATLEDAGYSIIDALYTWDHETLYLGDLPRGIGGLVRGAIRRAAHAVDGALFRFNPKLAARLRRGFNILVLAQPKGASVR